MDPDTAWGLMVLAAFVAVAFVCGLLAATFIHVSFG